MRNVILLTGASSGLGAALAISFGASGDRIALIARREDRLRQVAEKVTEVGGESIVIPCDVSDRNAVHKAAETCRRELGPITMVIANAGFSRPMTATKFNTQRIEDVLRVNFFGVAHVIEAVLPGMIEERRGRIAATSSLASFRGIPGRAPYGVSKAAVNHLMESLRIELRQYNISVTTVLPGFVKTEMTASARFPMPFLMDADAAARRVHRAVRRGDAYCSFPWPVAAFTRVIRSLPSPIYDRLHGLAGVYPGKDDEER